MAMKTKKPEQGKPTRLTAVRITRIEHSDKRHKNYIVIRAVRKPNN